MRATMKLRKKTVDDILALGVKCVKKKFNVADKDAVEAAIQEIVNEFGRIDVLVNNAGITDRKSTRLNSSHR